MNLIWNAIFLMDRSLKEFLTILFFVPSSSLWSLENLRTTTKNFEMDKTLHMKSKSKSELYQEDIIENPIDSNWETSTITFHAV